jgi:AbiV family abortive infection protein
MADELKPEWSPDEPFIKGCLDHTGNALKGARALNDAGLPHFGYHLALLALEEIGKLEVVLMGRVATNDNAASFKKKFMDDHVGKIFWAFWGPTFTMDLIDPQPIEWHQELARKLHEKRLRGLYVEPAEDGTFVAPADQVSANDTRGLIEFAEMRLDMQREHEPATLTEEEKADLVWFRDAKDDLQQKVFILSPISMKKLQEVGNVRDWMKWLRESIEAQEAELVALAEAEMKREVEDGDIDRPKWEMRIRVKTSSHIIKPKAVNAWNERGTPFKWIFIQKPDEFLLEFALPKSIRAEELYEAGLSMCYRYITALNIGSQGFFWFDLPLQTVKYHERVIDLENKVRIEVGRPVVKRVNRTVEPLSDSHIHWIMIAFGLLPNDPGYSFHRYAEGLIYWAKTDIHSGFEVNAFGGFFDCFVSSMAMYGDWDGDRANVRAAAVKVLTPSITSGVEDTVEEIFNLADAYHPGQPTPEVTIEQAAIMKLLADVYLLGALDREGMRRIRDQKATAVKDQT